MGAPTDEDSQKVCSAAQGGPQLRSISKLCPELPQNTPKPRGPGSKWGGEGSGQDFPQDTEVGSLISGHTSAPEVGVAGAGTPTPGSVGSQREGGIGDCGERNCILISTAANCGGGRQTRDSITPGNGTSSVGGCKHPRRVLHPGPPAGELKTRLTRPPCRTLGLGPGHMAPPP